ncbi:MAG: NADH-quinone oxidoreductase subunit NuoE [Kiritimatiellae bacterium]|nr:NADH-quinone oxidoreductase subunit NuoE [Kiritimatiellia bacterium]
MQTNDRQAIQQIFSGYQGQRNELIPILQDVQGAVGYVPREAMTKIAHFLNIPESSVYGVVTFYAQFYLTRQGKHKIRVCQGTACHVRGGRRIMQAVEKKLGIKPGETTADYKFSLERVACFGSCALAPVMVVDGKAYGRITSQKAEKILESLN